MKLRFIAILLISVQILEAQQINLLHLEEGLRVYPLENYTRVFIDTSGDLTIKEVRQMEVASTFRPVDSLLQYGELRWSYWLWIPIISEEAVSDKLIVLKSPDSLFRYFAGNRIVEAYFFKNSESNYYNHYMTGSAVPASQRALPAPPSLNAFPFELGKDDTAYVYIRIQKAYHKPASLEAELRPVALSFPLADTESVSLLSFLMGVTGIVGLFCLFFFFAAGDNSYLFFALTCLCLCLHYTILHPGQLFIQWFIPEKPWLVTYAWVFLTHVIFIFFILFGRAFTGLRQQSRLLDNFMLVLAGSIFIYMVFQLFAVTTFGRYSYSFLLFLFFGIMLISLRIGFIRGEMYKIFSAGAMWLLLFSILGIMANKGRFQWFNPWPVGQMGLMVIYALGLAYKFKLQEKARVTAEKVLELDAVKSRFFANISHEFRTPLTLILGPIKKAQEQVPAIDQELFEKKDLEISIPSRHLGMMRQNAERLEQLIDQLLDLSKLESGNMKLKVSADDVIKFLRVLVFSFESIAEQNQIHFSTAFPPAPQIIYFDRDKLEKILLNLLSNAFKYTPVGGYVEVRVFLDEQRLKICVENSGNGIPCEDINRIFESFYQVEGTEDKGTGIGLCLVKELVDLYYGQIVVKSEPGMKTVFQVSLPVSKEAFDAESIVAGVQKVESIPNANPEFDSEVTGRENNFQDLPDIPTVLVVEDNPDLRYFIEESLSPAYRTLTAKDGKEGLGIANEHIPDLIISDVMMPGMNGRELCEHIKKDEHTSHIPVILLTAKAGQSFKIQGLTSGADVYLTKPFDEKELHIHIKNLITQRENLQERFKALAGQGVKNSLKPAPVTVTSLEEKFLKRVSDIIEENMDNEFFSVEDLAKAVNFSRSQLHRKLKALTGKSPTELIREFRLTRAKELLEKRAGNVSEIAIEVGYSSLSYFTRSFKAEYGILPSEV